MSDAKATFRLQGEDATAQAFKSALGRTQAFSKQAGSIMKGAFVGISLATITGAIGRTIELGDSLNKAAIKAGIAGSAMSELAHAAAMADVDLGSLSNGLKFMQINLSKAAEGGKEGAQVLGALGLKLDEIRALKADQQFEMIADRIASLKDPADRARAAVQIFGKAGAELLPLFEQGAEGIRKAREEAQRLGIALSQDQIDTLAEADDAIKRLSASFRGLGNVLVTVVGPTLTRTLDGITRIIQAAREGKSWIDLYREINAEQSKAQRSGVIERPKVAARGFGAADEMAKIAEAIEKAMKKAADAAADAREKAAKDAVETARAVHDMVVEIYSDLDQETRQAIDRTMGDVNSDTQRDLDEIDKRWQKFRDGQKEKLDEMSVFADQAARNMQDAFADFLFDPFENGIKGMLKGFVDILRRMVAEAAAAKLFEALGFGQKSGGGGGLLGGLLGGIFGKPGNSGAKLPGFANGGSFMVGGSGSPDSQLVAFRASPNERVTIDKPGQGGGTVVNINTHIDARGATSELISALPEILKRHGAQTEANIVNGLRRRKYAL
jgi:hypothetical protein